MVALRCLLVMYFVWLIISYTASHSILAVGAHRGLPASERVPDLCVCGGGVGASVREGKQAATLSRPNAQVQQLTSVTVGCVVVIIDCFLSNRYFSCGRQKAFPFQQFVSFIHVG